MGRSTRLYTGCALVVLRLDGDDATVERYRDTVALTDVVAILQLWRVVAAIDVQTSYGVISVDAQTVDGRHECLIQRHHDYNEDVYIMLLL